MQHSMKKIVLVIAMAFPIAAFAQGNKTLQAELQDLKNKIKQLEAMVEQVNTKAEQSIAASAADSEMRAEFNRVKLSTETMAEEHEVSGFRGLKISGYMDPTYIMNQRQNTSSFIFMKNFDDPNSRGGPGSNSSYAYDNGFFGSALLSIEKEMDDGTKWLLELMPHKSSGEGGGYNGYSIVNQAYVSVPIGEATNLIAGQINSWQGYEEQPANLRKTITGNLLFDFTGPTFITGVGLEHAVGDWELKGIVGNLNNGRITDHNSPVFHWRADYEVSEFTSFGFSGLHGKPMYGTNLNYLEADATYARGDITLQGQIEAGRFNKGSFNERQSSWVGLSALAAYKFTPRLEGVIRADYIRNQKNGGGTPNSEFLGCDLDTGMPDDDGDACGDYRNGFGPSLADIRAYNDDPSLGLKGANRTALTLGLNYTLNSSSLLKFEVRHDLASKNVFYDVKSDTYKKNNTLVGASVVVSF